ncbi:MAG: hypothetical protein IK078_02460 [Lachnospiraceae bacterium]|nr:hypothetical protein [Lachnospiraceae bacterium]
MIKVNDLYLMIIISYIFGIYLLLSVLPFLEKVHPFWKPEKAVVIVKNILRVTPTSYNMNVYHLLEISIHGQTRYVIGHMFHRVGDVVEVYHSPDLVIRRKKIIWQIIHALIVLVTGIVFWPTLVTMLHNPKVIPIYLAFVFLVWIGYPFYHMINYQLTLGFMKHGVIYDGPEPQKNKIFRIAGIAIIVIGIVSLWVTGLIALYFS